jgi:hypothetical protein
MKSIQHHSLSLVLQMLLGIALIVIHAVLPVLIAA